MAGRPNKSPKKKPRDGPKHQSFKKISKTNHESKEATGRKVLPVVMEDDAPDFPRGGKSVLSRQEEDEVRAEVDAEFEAEERELKKTRKTKHKKSYATEEDLGSLFGAGITGKLPRFANRITLKNVSPGMKLWGVICEVNQTDLVVSLPGGLRGVVRASEASDLFSENEVKQDTDGNYLSSIFYIGQLVSCLVLQVNDDKMEDKGKKKIWLSLRLSLLHKGLTFDAVQEGMILSAYVKSIEDHGCILHFGFASFSGFLPIKAQTDSGDAKMITGQLLQGVVRSIDKARRVVYLSSDPDMVSKCVTKDLKGISIDLLVPGMMVNARVESTLENGIMLSFLTYFTGTVDIFHMQTSFPATNWSENYSRNKKVNARILFIDPSTRAVGLTMNPHLLYNKAPPCHVKIGDIYDGSRVVRVDKGLGLLLEIPSAPLPTPAYVGIFDVADEKVQKLEKKFKAGNNVRVRIHGLRHLEGIAVGVLKASAFEGSVFSHSDVKPGMVVKAKVIAVESFGAIVQLSSAVKALCPLPHMSEFDIAKPRKKFKIGAELVFRVLGCKSKRITVTHKKTLVKSKLGILSSYADATDGLVTHGWITKIEKHGCFVRFYNGVQGFAPRYELGLELGCDASSMYHVGQVVKCRVVSIIPASRRINLSFILSSVRAAVDDIAKVGSLVSGIVERLTPEAVIVHVKAKVNLKGSISTEHLADHQGHAALMKSTLKPGYEFDQLLVLDLNGNNLILSAKYSLINSANQIPVDLAEVHPNSVVPGYVCNIIDTGCFVRFLGRLTGFSPKNKATDSARVNLSEAFYIGQSVRSKIVNVNGEMGRITLSLKQSSCYSTDASFLQGHFLLEEKVARLQMSESVVTDANWVESFKTGSIVEGEIHQSKDFGVVLSFKEHNDVFGFISHYHLGGTSAEIGSVVRAVVLDISLAERLVDLSLKPELVHRSKEDVSNCQTPKKKRKREPSMDLEVHKTVKATVEMVKENYLVLSLPEHNNAIGYASLTDYNTQKLPQEHLVNGQSVLATIEALPSPLTTGRLLLLLNSHSEVAGASSSKRAKKRSSYNVGSLVEAEITDIKPLEMSLKFGIGFRGRVHITEVNDGKIVEDPFSKFKIGQLLTARIVGMANQSEKTKKINRWELSVRPTLLSGAGDGEGSIAKDSFDFSTGQCVTGYVVKVVGEWVWLAVSRHLKACVFFLDSSTELSELQEFQNIFHVGKAFTGYVFSVNKEKKLLRLVSRPLCVVSNGKLGNETVNMDDPGSTNSNKGVAEHIHKGDILCGRITKIFPGVGGLHVQIGPHLYGKVHFTELADKWAPNPLLGYHEGKFVKCEVLEIGNTVNGPVHVDLSLRTCLGGIRSQKSVGQVDDVDFPNKRVENIEDFHPNMAVKGYVKNVSKGCFIMLSRKIDAKILLSNLSDGFIENPEKEFPVGKLVNGKVLSVEPLSKRVEVTLKSATSSGASKSGLVDLSSLHVGDVISGRIRRVETYGLFIIIDNTNVVGLCHLSELSDDHIDNIESKYRAGDSVVAKVLKVDEERHRISLGMKSSYIRDDTSSHVLSDQNKFEAVDGNGSSDDSQISTPEESSLRGSQDAVFESGENPILAEAESRASIMPLEVALDDMEDSDSENIISRAQEHVNEADSLAEKNKRRAKRKQKEEREKEIVAAEARLLAKDKPTTADEFEKLVRSSPNSSFVWIKYMDFALSLSDVEKARSIAERALRTINIREEAEKLNIWVAYFNIENEYGNPRQEAVMKVFQRALQYSDPKKVHFALLGLYERTEQQNLVDELLEKMVKKYKHSCKVWLRRVQSLLKQGKDVQPTVNRALLSLPRNKHIKFISQTAILEFKCAVPDRGRTMFEGMLREYPKRTDLWSIYLDQEIRLGDVEFIRALFERATSLSLPPKKMKFLFKKYLEYEKSQGDDERVEYVKKKAMEYVESSLTGS
ncbi:rRNA biogenesis protein RRP5 isoform X1 [Macadamia integrifolia]|uniref:rRNA biogenesis protein RRP5 isoform X1 n=1 Tax=Macadamia integrifolia TaxID=60698 RepID=UPI001C527872|nr:rRNA biogenesis protein RRP5 isoform X1 [Macadamia integrifolia]XP_042480101.1 rRNA biogenesis protein RRP5 isoform X1 [Macadamia integrifolia]